MTGKDMADEGTLLVLQIYIIPYGLCGGATGRGGR